jgi:hypothetical protein
MVYLPGIEKSGGIYWGRLWLRSHAAIEDEEDNDDDDSGE